MPTLMKKANGERLVPDEKVAEYLEMGYSVINSDGEVLKEPAPTTPAQFRKIMHDYDMQLLAKDDTIAALTAENNTLKETLASLTKPVTDESAADTVENGAYKPEEAADTVSPANSAPQSETAQKGVSGAKNRKPAKAAE